jgi:hypothetical protein
MLLNILFQFEERSTSYLLNVWKNSVHPAINRRKWTKEEEKTLSQIVEKNNAVNWDNIAKELNVGYPFWWVRGRTPSEILWLRVRFLLRGILIQLCF